MIRQARSASRLLPLLALLCGAAPAGATSLPALVARITEDGMRARLEALVGERATAEQQAATVAALRGALEACGYAVTTRSVGSSENVVATLTGATAPERVFVVGAHFDTVAGSPGADDNASGVAGLLEIACALAGERPAATIELVGFALEEVGLLGSTAHADDLLVSGRQVAGMISLEMIGYTCPIGCQFGFFDIPSCLDVSEEFVFTGLHVAVVGNEASAAWKEAFVAAAAAGAPDLALLWGVVAGDGQCIADSRRSDHAPFWDRGYPALLVTDTANFRNANYHTANDTLETLDVPFATRVARSALATVAIEAGVVPAPGPAAAGTAAVAALAALAARRR